MRGTITRQAECHCGAPIIWVKGDKHLQGYWRHGWLEYTTLCYPEDIARVDGDEPLIFAKPVRETIKPIKGKEQHA